jgi:hypothetical protein
VVPIPVYLGIDWSQAKHDAVFLNEAGAVITQLTLPYRPKGLLQLDATGSNWVSGRRTA